MNDNTDHLLNQLGRSRLFGDYERAFGETTGLPLTLSPVQDWHLAHHGRRHENPFCALLAERCKSCAACLRTQHELGTGARDRTHTVTCFAGLCETAVPLRLGEKLIGFVRTGEVMLRKPTRRHFSRIVRRLVEWGLKGDVEELRKAFFQSRVLSSKQYESAVQLLTIFAQHLSIVSNQVALRSENPEPPNIARAREFIEDHHAEDVSLNDVAKAVHMSTFYFCKQFKKATGMSFTQYIGRLRVEKAKHFLLNPHARISEVAYETGFQSLTHFNRVFRNLTGESPTDYRAHAPEDRINEPKPSFELAGRF